MANRTTAKDEAAERARLLALAVGDFRTFCRSLVVILGKDSKRHFLKWNPIQSLYCAARTPRDIVLKPRQIGQTTLELARDLWRFLQPGQRVVVVCQSMSDDAVLKDLSAKIQRMIVGLRQAGLQLPLETESATRWTMPSRDSSLTLMTSGASEVAAAKKGRASTVTRVHVTECAFWEHPELTLNALLESVPNAPDTEVIYESTPNGAGNWFHQQYMAAVAGTSAFKAHFYAWYDDPTYAIPLLPGEAIEPATDRERELVERRGVQPEQLKWYREKLRTKSQNQDLVDQEYASDPVRCFLASGRKYFDGDALDRLAGRLAPPIEIRDNGLTKIWARPEPGARYLAVTDPAEGLGEDGDWSATTFWNVRRREHVATVRTKLREGPHARLLQPFCADYNNALNVVERNKGMALIAALENLREPRVRVYYDEDEKPGIATTPANKPVMLETLGDAIRLDALHTRDEVLLAEARAMVVDPRTGKPHSPTKGRKNGTSDDVVMSAAIAQYVMQDAQIDFRHGTPEDVPAALPAQAALAALGPRGPFWKDHGARGY